MQLEKVARPPPLGTLYLGVHSWQNAESLRRRRVIRKLNSHTLDKVVMMRFIMPGGKTSPEGMLLDNEEGMRADLLRFSLKIKQHRRAVHKYLLANAFLRHAAALDYDFVGRTEDDALMDVSELGLHLSQLLVQHRLGSHENRHHVATGDRSGVGSSGGDSGGSSGDMVGSDRSSEPMLLYGLSGMWVMWDPTNLLPMCWNARGVARKGPCDEQFVGPFVLFQGPLVVYSRRLARALVTLPRFAADEARVGANWSGIVSSRLASPLVGSYMGIVHSGVAEDVYYSSLLASPPLGGALDLSIVAVPLSEYHWNKPKPTKPLPTSAVYHRVNTWYQLNSSGLVGNLMNTTHRRSGRQAQLLGAELPTERALRGDVDSTGRLGEWWRARKSLGRSLIRSSKRGHIQLGALPPKWCATYAAHFRAFQYKTERQKAVSEHFCCRAWHICEL
jgi:hypothetical protein